MSNQIIGRWLEAIGAPANYDYNHSLKLLRHIDHQDFDGNLYLQACGPSEYQKLLILYPKNLKGKCPAVAVPFYHPDGMVGLDLETGETLERFKDIDMARDLVKRGFITIVADAYPFHFYNGDPEISGDSFYCDFQKHYDSSKWKIEGEKLSSKYPGWTGIGKLIADTRLLIDVLCEDSRVDIEKIGIAGHSLGGKMAFYTGCLDNRIKVILASDFGIKWEQTNWSDIWYWGEKAAILEAQGMTHSQLLTIAAPKPFMLLAGQYDNEDSGIEMNNAVNYKNFPDIANRLALVNHATGHRPPLTVLDTGYDFMEYWLKK